MKLFFDIAVVDEYGTVHGRRRIEIDRRAAFIGTRAVDDMRMGAELGCGSFEATVELMKVREFRRKLLVAVATQGGTALADHLEDREGWHGLDRQERVNELYKS